MPRLIRIGCSALALTLASVTMATPGFAQGPTTEQDHKAHHPEAQPDGKMPAPAEHRGGMGMADTMKSMMPMCDMMGGRDGMAPANLEQRLVVLKTKLQITEAQVPQWNRFADALRGTGKTAHEMHQEMMQPAMTASLPDSIARTRRMIEAHLASLKAIEEAVQPLYATFTPAQKEAADAIRITPMGPM
jgi:hypothetical protein